jgi:hypothetical protein
VVDEILQIRELPAFALLIVKGGARYFVSARMTTRHGSRDNVDTCQRAPSNTSPSASLQCESPEAAESDRIGRSRALLGIANA